MKKARQVPKGKKRPKGYGQPVVSAEEIAKRLRTDPPRRSRGRGGSNRAPQR